MIEASPIAALAAPILPLVIEWIKDNSKIKNINKKTKSKTLAVAALVAAGCGLVTSLLNGDLDEGVVMLLVGACQNFIVVFGIQELTYRHLWKRYQKNSDK